MATLTFEYDTESVALDEIYLAIALNHGYNETMPNPAYRPNDPENIEPATVANTEMPEAFARRTVERFVLAEVKTYRTRLAVQEVQAAMVAAEKAVVEPVFKVQLEVADLQPILIKE